MLFLTRAIICSIVGLVPIIYAENYKISSDLNGEEVSLVKDCSLGKSVPIKQQKKIVGPLFHVELDYLRCSQRTPEKFAVMLKKR
jgi:hypothetical protein